VQETGLERSKVPLEAPHSNTTNNLSKNSKEETSSQHKNRRSELDKQREGRINKRRVTEVAATSRERESECSVNARGVGSYL
jgi:hypothetical protein